RGPAEHRRGEAAPPPRSGNRQPPAPRRRNPRLAAERPALGGAGRRRHPLTVSHQMRRRGIKIGTRVRAYLACILGIVLGLGVFGFLANARATNELRVSLAEAFN